jgi:hypothetical protein
MSPTWPWSFSSKILYAVLISVTCYVYWPPYPLPPYEYWPKCRTHPFKITTDGLIRLTPSMAEVFSEQFIVTQLVSISLYSHIGDYPSLLLRLTSTTPWRRMGGVYV